MENEKCFGVWTARRLSRDRHLRQPYRWQKCTSELCIYRVLFVTTVTVLCRDQCFVVIGTVVPGGVSFLNLGPLKGGPFFFREIGFSW
jgi:hypothetical protein